MASSKRGGDIKVLTQDVPKTGGKGSSSSPSRGGLSKNLTADEVKQAVEVQEARAINGSGKGSGSGGPSTGNAARRIKGDL